MDPGAFGSFYSPLATAIPPAMRYPYPPTPSTTPSARAGMIFYPQPLSVSEATSQATVTSAR